MEPTTTKSKKIYLLGTRNPNIKIDTNRIEMEPDNDHSVFGDNFYSWPSAIHQIMKIKHNWKKWWRKLIILVHSLKWCPFLALKQYPKYNGPRKNRNRMKKMKNKKKHWNNKHRSSINLIIFKAPSLPLSTTSILEKSYNPSKQMFFPFKIGHIQIIGTQSKFISFLHEIIQRIFHIFVRFLSLLIIIKCS